MKMILLNQFIIVYKTLTGEKRKEQVDESRMVYDTIKSDLNYSG